MSYGEPTPDADLESPRDYGVVQHKAWDVKPHRRFRTKIVLPPVRTEHYDEHPDVEMWVSFDLTELAFDYLDVRDTNGEVQVEIPVHGASLDFVAEAAPAFRAWLKSMGDDRLLELVKGRIP